MGFAGPAAPAAPAETPSAGGRASLADVMRELNLPVPETTGAQVAVSVRDPFGIVGTTQADTFQVEKVVAHGGFGVIYKATHLLFRAPVALKCLKIPVNLTTDERTKFFERFRAEGEVMFRLTSSIPEIVRPLHVDALKLPDGRFVPFIALEWLDGETLKDVIVRRIKSNTPPMSIRDAVSMLSPIASALSKAHKFPGPDGQLAILHCDLKPDNLFVLSDGTTIKIFDFGIAKVRAASTREAGGATRADGTANMFTPAYAAPEQWAPDKFGQTGAWTDVFALALTLTELSTQRPAIDGAPAAMLAQAFDLARRPTPKRLGLDIPDAVDDVFARALAVDPKQRIQSIEAFWSELESVLDGNSDRRSDGDSSKKRGSKPRIASHADPKGPAMMRNMSGSSAGESGGPSFDGDLDVGAPAKAASSAPPPPAFAHSAGAFSSGIELGGEPVPAAPIVPQHAPPPGPAPGAPSTNIESGAFDLIDQPERPPNPTAGGQNFFVPEPEIPEARPSQKNLISDETKEKLQAAALVARQRAEQAAVSAAGAARGLAMRAVEVDHQPIQLDDPSTWIRPMRGPLIVFGAAIAITIAAVVVNSVTSSNFPVRWISLPLMLGAIGFVVYRWIKIQKE